MEKFDLLVVTTYKPTYELISYAYEPIDGLVCIILETLKVHDSV